MPARHGSSADAPGGQKLDALQILHAVAPLASWYAPPLHETHEDWPSLAVIVPGAQSLWVVEPAAHAEPAGQAMHIELFLLPYSGVYVPPSHGTGKTLPCGQ